eukprot:1936994-Rhodomonas_salina.1
MHTPGLMQALRIWTQSNIGAVPNVGHHNAAVPGEGWDRDRCLAGTIPRGQTRTCIRCGWSTRFSSLFIPHCAASVTCAGPGPRNQVHCPPGLDVVVTMGLPFSPPGHVPAEIKSITARI